MRQRQRRSNCPSTILTPSRQAKVLTQAFTASHPSQPSQPSQHPSHSQRPVEPLARPCEGCEPFSQTIEIMTHTHTIYRVELSQKRHAFTIRPKSATRANFDCEGFVKGFFVPFWHTRGRGGRTLGATFHFHATRRAGGTHA